MNLLTILGSIGGTIFLISWIMKTFVDCKKIFNNYCKYKTAYDKQNDEESEEDKKTMGFKTEIEELEEKIKALKEKAKITVDKKNYWNLDIKIDDSKNEEDEEFIDDENLESYLEIPEDIDNEIWDNYANREFDLSDK